MKHRLLDYLAGASKRMIAKMVKAGVPLKETKTERRQSKRGTLGQWTNLLSPKRRRSVEDRSDGAKAVTTNSDTEAIGKFFE